MTRAGDAYSLTEWIVAYKAETTCGTANVTTMQKINVQGLPSFSENVWRSIEQKSGVGRTKKKVDVKVQTIGQEKSISGTSLFNATMYRDFLENATGLNAEVTGELKIPYNYTSPTVLIGDTDTDNTGTFTLAIVPPEAANAQIWAGCACTSLRVHADIASEGGYFLVDWTFTTKSEIAVDQATPTAMVAYTTSELGIYDFCNTSTYNSVDVTPIGFEMTINPNVKFIGVCNDGNPISISRGHPSMEVTGSLTVMYDTNTNAFFKFARAAVPYPLALSDGDNINITITDCMINDDTPPSDNDNTAVIVLPFEALAGTSGNLASIEIGENS